MFYNLFRIFSTSLSLFCTYFIIDYLHPNKLPTPYKVDFKYLFFECPFIKEVFFYTILVWLIFYWLLRLLMQFYVDKVIANQTEEMSSFNPKKDMPKFFSIVFSLGNFLAKLIPKRRKILDYELNKENFVEGSISFILVVIHLTLFVCLTFRKIEINFVLISIILIITFVGLPYIYVIYDKIEKYVEDRLYEK